MIRQIITSSLYFNLFTLYGIDGLRDTVRQIEEANSDEFRSRGIPLLAGRGLSVYVRNNPGDPLAINYRYVRDGDEHWTHAALLTPPGDDIVADQFGGTYSSPLASINYFYNMDLIQTHIAGNILIAGAAYTDGSEPNTGSVYIYSGEWAKWSHQQTLTLEKQNENDWFGTSVTFNQADLTTAAISCLGCDPFYTNSSATYIYGSEPPFHNRWSQQQVLIPYNKDILYLGYGLKMHKDTLVISGTSRDDVLLFGPLATEGWYGTGMQSHVYVYHRPPGSRFWTEQQQLEGAADSYSLAFMVQVEDETIGISDGRTGGWSGLLKIYYPDTPRYSAKQHDQSWTSDHSSTSTNFLLNDVKPRPRSPQWSLQQILVDPLGTTDAAFGSYFSFHGNSMAVTRPLAFYSGSPRALYIYERPFLGGLWSVQQIFQFTAGVDHFPVTWSNTNIVIGDSVNDVQIFSTSQEWSCLVISMEDAFGDGWDNARILASAPDGTFDVYRPYCGSPNPLSFRYCPSDGADRGLYTFTIEDALKSKFPWEIQWQVYEEKTGIWYRGDHRTRMDFYWEPTTRDFTRRGIVSNLPLNISCIDNCKARPTPKPSPPVRALKSSSHAPTISPAPTLDQTSDTTWEYFTMTGDGWFNNAHRGSNYYISDIHGKRLLSTGTKCDQFATQNCWQALPDGEYILRVTGQLNLDPSANRRWFFCGRTGTGEDMLVFEVSNGQCDAIESYSRTTYCSNKLNTKMAADITFLLYGVSQLSDKDYNDITSSLSYLLTETTPDNIHVVSAIPNGENLMLQVSFKIPVTSYGYDLDDLSSIRQSYNTFINQLQNFQSTGQLREALSATMTSSNLNHVRNVEILENHINVYDVLPQSTLDEQETIITFEPPVIPQTYYEPIPSKDSVTYYTTLTEQILVYSGAASGYIMFGMFILITLFYIQSKVRSWVGAPSTSPSSTTPDGMSPQNIMTTTELHISSLNKQIHSNAYGMERNFISFLDDIGDVVVDIISPPPDEEMNENNQNSPPL